MDTKDLRPTWRLLFFRSPPGAIRAPLSDVHTRGAHSDTLGWFGRDGEEEGQVGRKGVGELVIWKKVGNLGPIGRLVERHQDRIERCLFVYI